MVRKLIIGLFLVLVTLSIISCAINEGEFINKFPKLQQGITVRMSEDLITKLPASLDKIGTNLLITNPYSKDAVVTIFDSKTFEEITSWGSLGHGPGEFISPFPEQYNSDNNILTISDNGNKLLREIKISENVIIPIKTLPHNRFGEDAVIDIFRLTENRFLIRHYIKNQAFLEIQDTIGNIISKTQLCPIKNICNYARATYIFHYIEKKNTLIVGMAETGYICRYEIENDKIVLVWERFMTYPRYDIEGDVLKWNNETNKLGFWCIKSDNESIYALYTGYEQVEGDERLFTAPARLLKFGLDGSAKADISLDKPIMKFCLGNDEDEIYGIAISPNFHIRQFSIKDF